MTEHDRTSRTMLLRGIFGLVVLAVVFPRPLTGQQTPRRVETGERPAVKAETLSTDAQMRALIGTPGDERRISERLRHRDRATVRQIAGRLRAGASFEDVRGQWVALARSARPGDVDVLVQWVLREAYGEHLQQVRLQESEQKMQQTLQTMSNVSKSMHDVAMASIRNMKG